ncbi:hypothetical protein I7I48_08327 [Histoplasma ohiense]|nr:hypothetical protein I7I48_08327 [Histoplasma ohiense (nom. inval.)]
MLSSSSPPLNLSSSHPSPSSSSSSSSYRHHDDHDSRLYSPQQPLSSNSPSPHSYSRNDAPCNPRSFGASNPHHIVHPPQIPPQSSEPPSTGRIPPYLSPQSITDQTYYNHHPLQLHGLEQVVLPRPSSTPDRTHAPAPQIPTRSEACRIHYHSNHDVLVSGHSSPRSQRMEVNDDEEEEAAAAAAVAEEEEGEDGDAIGEDEDQNQNEDGLEVVRSTEMENAFFILVR